jgi:hypothetical protein
MHFYTLSPPTKDGITPGSPLKSTLSAYMMSGDIETKIAIVFIMPIKFKMTILLIFN